MVKKKSEEIAPKPKFFERFKEATNGIWEPIMQIIFVLAIIFGVTTCIHQEKIEYDATHASYQEYYQPSGIFDMHPLEALGPNEVAGSEYHGTFFSVLFLSAGELDGTTKTTLNLRFKWQDPSGAYKLKEYPYESINFRVDEIYPAPLLKLIFARNTLNRELAFEAFDYTIYNFNTFFADTVAIDIYLNQATYNSEMEKLKIK